MRSTWLLSSLLACSFSVAACTYEDVDTSTTEDELVGESLNGQNLNGQNLNGTGLGHALMWTSYYGARDGQLLRETWLEGSELIGEKWNGHLLRGDDLKNARFIGVSDTFRLLDLRVRDVTPPAEGDDVWHYNVDFRYGSRWIPLCLIDALTGEGLNGPLLNGENLNQAIQNGEVIELAAIPVDGHWDYRSGVIGGGAKMAWGLEFMFACPRIGAIGKCIEAGYKPWGVDELGQPLDKAHEACVRMMRADYCGDGTPHTVDGTLVNVYDAAGVQYDEEPWLVEAEWDDSGARCVTEHLRQTQPVSCYDALLATDCGSPADWDGGTLIVSETP